MQELFSQKGGLPLAPYVVYVYPQLGVQSFWREFHVLAFPALWQPKEPCSADVEYGSTVTGRGNANPMRLGKREELERAGLIGVG